VGTFFGAFETEGDAPEVGGVQPRFRLGHTAKFVISYF
jgi:hypothetical protein